MTIERQIELLNKVIQYIADIDKFQAGICNAVDMQLSINVGVEELLFISALVKKNKPTSSNQFSKYMKTSIWYDGFYWWKSINPNNPETRQIRIDFLNDLISTLK